MGSRAVVLICRDADVAARPVRRRPTAEPAAPSTPAPGGRSSLPDLDRATARPAARRGRPRPGCGTNWTPAGSCSTANCCRGRPRPRTCSASSTRPVGAAAGAALPAALDGLRRGRRRRRRRGRAVGPHRQSGGRTPRRSPMPTAATAGRSTASTGSASPRSRCWPPQGATWHERDHGWHLGLADRLVAGAPDADPADPADVVDTVRQSRSPPARAGGRSSPPPAARAWSSSRWPT